jgi:DNA polymerase-1
MPKLILIDGSSYLYRAFHALPPLSNARGEPTGALFGVVNMLRATLKAKPDYLAFVSDAPGPTFRDALYDRYKANRPPMPDELRAQVEPMLAIVGALGFPILRVDGVEADDVIGTLAVQARALGMQVEVSTSDKDMAQLVDPQVTLVNTMTGTVMDSAGVMAKFGVRPDQIIDFLTLTGDAIDNIPGVPKCGPKTAAKWLAEHESLDGLMANADKIGGKIGENLRAALAQLPLSRQLVTIKTDVALEFGPTDLAQREPDVDRLRELYTRYEFKAALKDLDAANEPAEAHPVRDTLPPRDEEQRAQHALLQGPGEYELVTTQAALDAWLEKLRNAELIAFDTETTSIDAQQAQVVGVSFAVEPGEAAYVPLAHSYMGVPQQLDRDAVLKALKPLLEDPNKAKVGQHAKYDINVLANASTPIEVRGVAFDTMLESYVLNSTATRHDMDSLALKYLGHSTIRFEDIAGKGAKQLTFDQIALEQAGPYAAEDADVTLRLHQALWEKLQAIPSLAKVLTDIEMPLVPVLARIERNGALVDANLLGLQSRELGEKMVELERKSFELAGQEFNLGSPKQLGAILYEKLGLPVLAKTATGQPSTAENVLADLAEQDYELPKVIMQYRSLSKLKSTYTDKLPEQINPRTGRIHTSYHQAVAATGRLSSTDPNLQNIPIRTAEGRRIRQAFVAPAGCRLLSADYSQIELRIMAHLAQDEGLLDAFRHDRDVHRATAAEVFGLPLDEVTPEQRRRAKAINFGLIYGMSAFGLAKQIGVERKEAQAYIDRYFARYPGVLAYMERTRAQAAEQGYVETLYGRRLYLPEIGSKNAAMRKAAERTAINAPMQGTAADIMKLAMVAVDDWLQASGIDARVILQVHDELVLEVREDLVEEVAAKLRDLMGKAAELAVPLIVETGSGSNWDEAH